MPVAPSQEQLGCNFQRALGEKSLAQSRFAVLVRLLKMDGKSAQRNVEAFSQKTLGQTWSWEACWHSEDRLWQLDYNESGLWKELESTCHSNPWPSCKVLVRLKGAWIHMNPPLLTLKGAWLLNPALPFWRRWFSRVESWTRTWQRRHSMVQHWSEARDLRFDLNCFDIFDLPVLRCFKRNFEFSVCGDSWSVRKRKQR